MDKPKGGRGLKAEYPTTVVRVPVALVPTVNAIVYIYRASGTDWVAEIAKILQAHSLSRKSTRDWTVANKLIDQSEAAVPAGTTEHLSHL